MGGDRRLSFANERESPVSVIWTALAPVFVHAAADLNDVWVTTRGLQNLPTLAFVWGAIAALAVVLVAVWARREHALQRSLARLRSIL